MAAIISGIYKIINTVTGDFYIGSSKNVNRRWACHKCLSTWNECPNNPMYIDMKEYGVNKFEFEILAEVEPEKLKETEQKFIEKLKPTYNNYNANGFNTERRKERQKEYCKEYHNSDKYKEYQKEYNKKYQKSDKYKEYKNKYQKQLCYYNGETLTLSALSQRFRRSGIKRSILEAKKYILTNYKDK